jgi:ketosteroid isomerase-like protein
MSKNIEIVQQIYGAYGRGDMKFILDQMDDDVSWGIESVASGEVAPFGVGRGKTAVARFFAAWGECAEFHSFNPHDYIAAGDHVFNHLQYDITVKATGKPAKNFSLQHWTFKNGKLIRWRGYEDTAATREAFGRANSA